MDLSALIYLVSKASLTGKIARWTLLLQEFEFEIYHRMGVQHAVADYLSRLESNEAGDGVRDEFPYAELFRVTTELTIDATVAEEDKWLTDMHKFLSTGLRPKKMIGTNGSGTDGSEPPFLPHPGDPIPQGSRRHLAACGA